MCTLNPICKAALVSQTENMAVNYMAVHAKEGRYDWGTGSRNMQQALMSEIFV